uniref:Reverse transcriptase domain-containing protein n=1 Tax=Caenorhabditis japonica TaxID=281687 RepID=A0A8R1DVU2_CAEJA
MEDCCESVLKTNEMAALDPMDGSGTSSTKNSERTSDELLVSVKQRRKLFKNFARFVDAADEVEKKVMEKLLSVQMCTERQRDMIVGPIEKFRKELCERFEELGRDKWPRTVLRLMREQNVETVEEIRELCERGRREGKSSTSEKLKNYQNNMTVLQTENERLQERIRKCESEKLAAEKRLRKAQRAFEAEKRTAEGLKANLQHAAGEFEICRVQDEKHQIIQKRSRRASGSPTDSRRSSLRSRTREQSQGTLEEEESGDDWRRKVNGWDIQREKAVHSEKTENRRIKNAGSLSGSERSEMKGMVECMSRMMKSSALPEPRCFDGSGDFGELKRTFLLKYGQVTSGDDELVAILEDKFLKGSAKALFKSLARRYERPIKSLFDEFEMKLRKRQGDSKAEALNEFDGLKREKSKKMWEYLTEVEKWSKLAYPEVSEETLSQMRTTKLMKAVRDDDTLHRMLIMKRLEIPLRHQYENLKDIVLQQENEKRRAYGQKKRENAVVRGKPWMDRADERRNNPHKEDRKDDDIFAIEDNELTQTNMTECAIELEKEEPIRQKCRPVPLALQEKVRGMLKDMEERCVIKKCRSPWASPVVLVKKKDGSIRMCVDYRKLNAVIKLNAHPLPHIESTLQALRGKKWFTTLDLMAGYWQIPMEEESKEKTAFTVLNEQYQFEVMPFGLATSPAVFQATMEETNPNVRTQIESTEMQDCAERSGLSGTRHRRERNPDR